MKWSEFTDMICNRSEKTIIKLATWLEENDLSEDESFLYDDLDNTDEFAAPSIEIPQSISSSPAGNAESKPAGFLQKLRIMLFGPPKYIYVLVRFREDGNDYPYRTADKKIKVNDIVMVPVTHGPERAAIVTKVITCTEEDAPSPLNRTKYITGHAKRKDRKQFTGIDLREPFDISYLPVQTKNGTKNVLTNAEQRKVLRRKLGRDPEIRLYESCPPADEKPAYKARPVINWLFIHTILDAFFGDD